MGLVKFEIAGITQAGLRFETFPDELREALRAKINELGQEAFAMVAAGVPRRTGRLAGQQELVFKDERDEVSATVDFDGADAAGQDFAKGGALEYGSRGEPQQVKGYKIDRTHVFDKLARAPYEAIIKAYQRTLNITATPFTRPVAAAMQGRAIAELTEIAETMVANFGDD